VNKVSPDFNEDDNTSYKCRMLDAVMPKITANGTGNLLAVSDANQSH